MRILAEALASGFAPFTEFHLRSRMHYCAPSTRITPAPTATHTIIRGRRCIIVHPRPQIDRNKATRWDPTATEGTPSRTLGEDHNVPHRQTIMMDGRNREHDARRHAHARPGAR